MGNPYFRFKSFLIMQQNCAMKVTTEACIMGALIPLSQHGEGLDIGAGTGLLSMMVAQRSLMNVTAIEIHERCANQCVENFEASKWRDRLKVLNTPIQNYESDKVYDLIVSNPPFYTHHMKSNNQTRNLALHNDELPIEALVFSIDKHLKEDGNAFLLYPPDEVKTLKKQLVRQGFRVHYQLNIFNKPGGSIFRNVIGCSRSQKEEEHVNFTIRTNNGEYTEAFKKVLSPFYLDL
jgi:tRNA1Val (adenine37-N6)-methyltransferase